MPDALTATITNSARRPTEAGAGATQPRPSAAPRVSDDLVELVDGSGVEPERARAEAARSALARDGTVVLPGVGSGPGATAVAAAELLGEGLRQLFRVRHRGAESGDYLDLHGDSFHVVHDIHGVLRPERDPDEDYLLMGLGQAPATGGESFVVDGYRVVDRVRALRPALHDFLTGTDMDIFGSWTLSPDLPGLPPATRVCRLVEFTRTGRRVVRANSSAQPLLRVPGYDESAALLAEFRDVLKTAGAAAPRFRLETGDVLVIDNYRCWHGREPFEGSRQLYVQTVRSDDAY